MTISGVISERDATTTLHYARLHRPISAMVGQLKLRWAQAGRGSDGQACSNPAAIPSSLGTRRATTRDAALEGSIASDLQLGDFDMASGVAENAQASMLEQKLSSDELRLAFELLSIRDLGAAACVCRSWERLLQAPAPWQRAAEKAGYVWEPHSASTEARIAASGGWRGFLQHERRIERLWFTPHSLRARLLSYGHQHWVPAILMEPRTRQLVTCSYDGTVRFWESPDSPIPSCFSVRLVEFAQVWIAFRCSHAFTPIRCTAIVSSYEHQLCVVS
eukprot:6194404-Pleurochrysis_carterae.AAC.6